MVLKTNSSTLNIFTIAIIKYLINHLNYVHCIKQVLQIQVKVFLRKKICFVIFQFIKKAE